MIVSLKLLFVSSLLIFQIFATQLESSEGNQINYDSLSPKEYDALMSTVQRGILAQLILQKLQRDEYRPIEENSSLEHGDDLIKNAKRFNRFQTGSTRTRAKLLQELREKLHGERRG